jgi:hypothetical protein
MKKSAKADFVIFNESFVGVIYESPVIPVYWALFHAAITNKKICRPADVT